VSTAPDFGSDAECFAFFRFNAHKSLFAAQFTRPSAKPTLVQDGNSDFFNFSTGRRAVRSLHTVFRMLPRHDFFQGIYQFAYSNYDLKYRPEDRVQLEFALDDAACAQFPDFVWAVVAKDELSHIRDERWDLVGLVHLRNAGPRLTGLVRRLSRRRPRTRACHRR
jgi:hypothetical protein